VGMSRVFYPSDIMIVLSGNRNISINKARPHRSILCLCEDLLGFTGTVVLPRTTCGL
jgi:hypothetical protein